MPDDFSAVATRLNSTSAIAEHYQVPSHTAQGWLRRLRATTN
jgi:transposase